MFNAPIVIIIDINFPAIFSFSFVHSDDFLAFLSSLLFDACFTEQQQEMNCVQKKLNVACMCWCATLLGRNNFNSFVFLFSVGKCLVHTLAYIYVYTR